MTWGEKIDCICAFPSFSLRDFDNDCVRYTSGEHYVYIWKEENTGVVFYVGSGKGGRYRACTPGARTADFLAHCQNTACAPLIVACGMSKADALKLEKELIEKYWKAGSPLVNTFGIAERQRASYEKMVKSHRGVDGKWNKYILSEHKQIEVV